VTPVPNRIGLAPGAAHDSGADGVGAAVGAALAALAGGRIIAYPTETFYGLGADPAREDAVAAIFAAKGRAAGEALPLIAADVAAVRRVAAVWTDAAARLAAAFWPGPLTIVVPVRSGAVAAGVTAGRDTVAVRVPGHALARELAAAAPDGLLTATSANRSGSPALSTADDVERALGAGVALIIDAGPTPGGLASTIVDVSGGPPRLIRPGPVPFDRVLESLR
jgi:L-threonylcarbamoyladenylate synthase